MCTCSAVRSSFVEVSCICMHTEYHATHSVDYAVGGVCGSVIQEHFSKLFCVYHCLNLLCTDGF
jgi:hypothetical protein